ncbi:aldehyde dehydrogenase [Dentipellis sp. KUC8613]|nr:aldehyde dehydrogenase [Dentipellis sp. KUC8613]
MSHFKHTPISELPAIYDALQQTFESGIARPLAWRRHQLYQLARMAKENRDAFGAAIHADLGKPVMELMLAEIGPIVERSLKSAEQLEEWAKPEKVEVQEEWQKGWGAVRYKTPKGVVLLISPWNAPMILSLQALIGAIAAGCPAVIKPSEISANYAQLLSELLPKYLDQSAYRVVNGGVEETTRLLELKWAHIFYIGNSAVARIIATAAAKHLIPVTLELGGKNPVFIDERTDLKIVAKRILQGRCTNAGQVCVSPDYLLVPRGAQDALVEAFREAYDEFFPNGSIGSDSYGRIINQRHFDRLQDLLARTKGTIAVGGKLDAATLGIEPTVIKDVEDGDSLLEGEIFGPFLPIVPVDGLDAAIKFVNSRPHPLVLYAFTQDPAVKQALIDRTRSGNLIFNDTVQQLAVNEIPLVGMGESGYGYQIMKHTFETFSHFRSSVDIPFEEEKFFAPRYPPFTPENVNLLASSWMNMEIPADPETSNGSAH